MDVSKCTPGPWLADMENSRIVGPVDPQWEPSGPCVIVNLYAAMGGFGDSDADAQIIAEAGTVAHETGLSPRQLAEQRAELLACLRYVWDGCEVTPSDRGESDFFERIDAVIAACK